MPAEGRDFAHVIYGHARTHPMLDFLLHTDQYLAELMLNYGPWIYGLLFGIVFAETGLVVTPFLPGDSLLFAAGRWLPRRAA